MSAAMAKVPCPPAWPILGHIPAFRRDVLGLLSNAIRDHGDLVRFKLGPRAVYLVNHPDAIRHVLKENARNYDKDTRSTRFIRDIGGEALLTSNGGAWQERRHLIQPCFHHRTVAGFETIMREECAALVARLEGKGECDAVGSMMHTTFRVVARALFGAEVPDAVVDALEAPIGTVLGETFARLGSLWGVKSRAFTRAMREVDENVAALLARRRTDPDAVDFFALLKAGGGDERALRDEAVTFLLAGHETTANALTWLLAHLSTRPDEQSRCARDPAALDRALSETLRLSPPIWIIERHALGPDEIAGFPIPAGSSVVICPYTVHRHCAFWRNPDDFDPDRFLEPAPPAYLPFGLGPRTCIGKEFAIMEARLIASALLARFEFSALQDTPPVPEPAITLRVRGGLRLRVKPRNCSLSQP